MTIHARARARVHRTGICIIVLSDCCVLCVCVCVSVSERARWALHTEKSGRPSTSSRVVWPVALSAYICVVFVCFVCVTKAVGRMWMCVKRKIWDGDMRDCMEVAGDRRRQPARVHRLMDLTPWCRQFDDVPRCVVCMNDHFTNSETVEHNKCMRRAFCCIIHAFWTSLIY